MSIFLLSASALCVDVRMSTERQRTTKTTVERSAPTRNETNGLKQFYINVYMLCIKYKIRRIPFLPRYFFHF